MVKVRLERAPDPTYMGEEECGICGVPFEVGAVYVYGRAEDWGLGRFCDSCIVHLGRRNPEQFPTIEEFEEAKKRYPEPIYTYEPEDELWLVACEVNRIDRDELRANA